MGPSRLLCQQQSAIPRRAQRPGHQRGVQPGRQAPGQQRPGQDGEGMGCRRPARKPSPSRGTPAVCPSVAFSPDGKRLVSGSEDETVKVWDAETGQETLTLKGHTGQCQQRGVQPGRQAARQRQPDQYGEGVGRRTGQETLTLKGHTDGVSQRGFSPDGKRIVTGSWTRR